MSQCVRSVSSRLISCVNSRKRLMEVDRRLPKHTKRCALLQKYDTLSISPPKVDELTAPYLTNRFVVGIHGNPLRPYSTASSSPKESVVVQNYDNSPDNEKGNEERRRPTPEQIKAVYKVLEDNLPKLFVAPLDYHIYHPDIEFVNNFKGITTKGITSYIKQMLYLRTSAHVMCAYVRLEVLKITMHPEDNTIKVRWRIRTLSNLKAFTMFWKIKILKLSESMQGLESWYDGFSTYYIGPDGRVIRHVADKMMPDDETIPAKEKPSIAAKLAA
ncbi:uncharacterized protein C6orf136 homolog [Diachasmimorpha longicaudata]|uniref:uncharacterized protein C6orf136 homolog n=1 Tax=Diachasmimorpha longicaudata TaxID=58733 RepID=UPI0030B8A226